MDWLLGFSVGVLSTITVVIGIIVIGIKKIDRMNEELENLDKDD